MSLLMTMSNILYHRQNLSGHGTKFDASAMFKKYTPWVFKIDNSRENCIFKQF